MSIIDRFRDSKDLEEENSRMRKSKKRVEKDLEKLEEDYKILNEKYVKILEEKGEGFNQYLYYHNQYADAYNTIKENKKELGEYRSDIRKMENNFADYCKSIKKYLPSVTKCESQNDFFIVLQTLLYINEELPLKSIISACKKFKVTKEILSNEFPELYTKFNMNSWEIEE